ncbi:MAG: N-acetylneuraminate synthase [Thermoflexales bacterium]|nr:N-acetylneuraminate synthase [Thermoflexales bacterium]
MPDSIPIAGRSIGPGRPCFVIAEAGVNHNGQLDMAYQLVDAAIQAGADAVKFQTFKAEKVISPLAAKATYQVESTGGGESQLDMVKRLELPFEAFRQLSTYCQERGIMFLSTPFDEDSVDFLADLNVPAFKIPSGEITNLPFLAHIAHKGKAMIVSTGMASLGEVETAVRSIEETGNENLVLLHCVSNYPANPADINLRAMKTMATAFGVPVGYSDHTLGIEVALAAVAVGACVIEKHFTLDHTLPGPDHRASLEPGELAGLVRGIRTVEAALGHGRKEPAASEANTAAVARRSLVAACDISEGSLLTEAMVAIKRPGSGLPPAMRGYVLGRTARETIPAGTLITLEMLA